MKLAVDPFLQASEHQYYMTNDFTVSEMRFQLVYQDSIALAKSEQNQDQVGTASPLVAKEKDGVNP